jgi:hypothetical protein
MTVCIIPKKEIYKYFDSIPEINDVYVKLGKRKLITVIDDSGDNFYICMEQIDNSGI